MGWGNVGLRGRCVGRKPHRDCKSPNNGIQCGTRQQRPYHCGAPGNVGGATQHGAIWPVRRQRTRHTINGGPQHGAHPTVLRPLILDRALNPRALWEQVGGAVINDGRELECRELLNWLCYALTLRKDPGGTPTALPPGSSLGAIGAALPTLRVDAPLQNHRWNILHQDLPALDPTRLAPTDQVVHLVQALRDEQAATHLAEVEARNRASALKTPSATFPQTAARWRTYCLAAGDDDLPPIYTIWANATKAERRVALQSALEERVNTGLAAGRITPLASKELYEIVLQGRFAASYHEVDDLTKGLQPFTCGFQSTERDHDVATRATQFDQMMAGLVAPSLAEQETFRTKEVPLPSTVCTSWGCS